MPLIPIHVAWTGPAPVSDAAATPDTTPDTIVARRMPFNTVLFELTWRISILVPPPLVVDGANGISTSGPTDKFSKNYRRRKYSLFVPIELRAQIQKSQMN